jgi:uncharacterized protein (DUF427 family)
MTDEPAWIAAARNKWHWRGSERPDFAVPAGPGQTSVWDFPRPPCLAPDAREVLIQWRGIEVARTRRAIRVLETAHPPSFYIPWIDVRRHLLKPANGTSFCEWKGPASYWSLVDGDHCLSDAAWSYPQPLAGAEVLATCVAFYPSELDCKVDGAIVRAQPGGFYGGWITPELVGPFKGEPGSSSW